jgi:hypothetical protein
MAGALQRVVLRRPVELTSEVGSAHSFRQPSLRATASVVAFSIESRSSKSVMRSNFDALLATRATALSVGLELLVGSGGLEPPTKRL